ncbi:DEAD/DEAH box helicase [Nitrosopumilus sp.]|jgi:SNF2 family DNA or RNA helicase|nr:DNA helicase [Nitrosopumilus sp.]MCH1548706.1 DEAD/DEAH box helicase [Nitrosopumilus sp.]MDC0173490.1 DEAD/DEAH box helicase [Nitrosopumilus sp.]MDC0209180.1 DEAD/DEAH box helicase [Nitrosopumilus sp.]MDC0209722.1 DEAD/DEAH box helicase [Nitrosopumilus sp.]|tara:strand:+ start:103 stop:1827 length:1725 start_codon:yes stop_codon:yes gene_type:complete
MTTSLENFGTLEYVQDKYSKLWCWKITGKLAIDKISSLSSKAWYGENENEVIIEDSTDSIKQLKLLMDRFPLEILSKTVWQRKIVKTYAPKPTLPPIKHKLKRAKPGEQFRGKLMNFQKEGLDFLLKSSGNALLADEMGLGKTVQTLSYVSTEKQTFPVLIVAPLVTLNNWEREIEKFLKKKSRNGRILESNSPSVTLIRTGKSKELPKTDIYVINYELLLKRSGDLEQVGIRTIVCDEVHNLRSKTTQKYKAVKKLAALPTVQYRIGLSGTPIYNRGSEIWPIIDILKPGLLGSFKEFCEYFCYVNDKGKAIVLENKRASLRNELQKHVMLRRKKADVLKELKDKVRYKEVIASDTDYYLEELDKIWKKLEDEQKEAQTEFSKSASYHRAIQSERQIAGVAKLPHVINFVKNIMEIEESVVVFCHHKVIHKLLHESLQEFSPVSIIGGQTDSTRQDQIDKFQKGESKLMIAGIRAGNVGINLTKAKYVIFAELDWSPAIHRQAEDRLHRIGQKNTVFAYYLIGNGTLDDHVASILVDKSYEIDAIMDETVDTYENKDKAALILAQIQDKIHSK